MERRAMSLLLPMAEADDAGRSVEEESSLRSGGRDTAPAVRSVAMAFMESVETLLSRGT